jgi:ATP-binding cassette subfamily F protein uup
LSAPLVQIKGARLSLGGAPLFSEIDFTLGKGERVALIGANGAGKSTLMRVLAGLVEPDEGERTLTAGARFALAPQEPSLAGFPTLIDYVAAEPQTPRYKAEAALQSFSLIPDRRIEGLSGGETRRASLARAFAADADILLLDEPTNHLDIAAIESLEQRLLSFRGAALIVSHDRAFLRRVSTACLWLRDGRVRTLAKGYAQFEDWAIAIEAEEAKALARLETQLRAEEHWYARGVTARRTRNEGRARRLEAMRSERRRRKSLSADPRAAIEAATGADSGRLVIEARGLNKTFPGAAQPIVRDFSVRIMRGDRIGVVGPNGAGKTTLLDLLLKRSAPDAGLVRHGAQIEMAYVDQRRSNVRPQDTIRDTLAPLGGDHINVRGRSRHIGAYAKDFLFAPEQLRQPVSALSGGERSRLALAAALARPANLLVLDEPTNDLDMDTLDALEEALSAYDGTVIVVSHDRAFLDGVATQIIGARGAGCWVETAGGYSDFERENGPYRAPRDAAPDRSAAAPPSAAPRRATKLSYKDEFRSQEIEALLPRLEAEIAGLERRLADQEGFAADPSAFAAAAARLAAAKDERDRAETEWLEIEERRAALSGRPESAQEF